MHSMQPADGKYTDTAGFVDSEIGFSIYALWLYIKTCVVVLALYLFMVSMPEYARYGIIICACLHDHPKISTLEK